MAASQRDAVREIVSAATARAGLVLEDVTVTGAGRRRVVQCVVDLPEDAVGAVSLDAVSEASQAISTALDDADVLGQTPYVLEVTSPGISRPLTERRHYARARTRLVAFALADGSATTGRISDVDDDGVVLADGRTLAWEQLRRGAVQVEFSSPAEEHD